MRYLTIMTRTHNTILMTDEFVKLIRNDNVIAISEAANTYGFDMIITDDHKRFHIILRDHPSLFSLCCFFGAIYCIDFLISCGVIYDQQDQTGRHCHHCAAVANRVDVLARSHALFNGDCIVQLLLPDMNGKTILHYAAQYDCVDIFRYCAVHFKNPQLFDILTSCTPLSLVCLHHCIKCFHFLVDLNIDQILTNPPDAPFRNLPIDFNRESGMRTPLVLLLNSGAYELIPFGQRAGMNVNAPLSNGWPLINHAIRNHSEKLVVILCRYGAQVNWSCHMGWTPFDAAAQERMPATCRLLCEYGANPHLFTEFGYSGWI
jgi:ankyrin repeat protein